MYVYVKQNKSYYYFDQAQKLANGLMKLLWYEDFFSQNSSTELQGAKIKIQDTFLEPSEILMSY